MLSPRKFLNSVVLVGGGQWVIAWIFTGSVSTPCWDISNETDLRKNWHFPECNLRRASCSLVSTCRSRWRCSSQLSRSNKSPNTILTIWAPLTVGMCLGIAETKGHYTELIQSIWCGKSSFQSIRWFHLPVISPEVLYCKPFCTMRFRTKWEISYTFWEWFSAVLH